MSSATLSIEIQLNVKVSAASEAAATDSAADYIHDLFDLTMYKASLEEVKDFIQQYAIIQQLDI